MAKGSRDVILRDRLQFDVAAGTGNVSLVYGRVDLSDYVSIVKNEGLAIKEIRFQFRDPNTSLPFPTWMNVETPVGLSTLDTNEASIRVFATTTAYELASDVGIASPNVICMYERISTATVVGTPPTHFATAEYEDHWYGTPDLHPEGYDVVTDLLIGVTANGLLNGRLAGTTQELDIMIIAEPKKITSKDLTQMLTQAQDL